VSTLSSLYSQKSEKEKERKKLRTRLEQLSSLQSGIQNTSNGYLFEMNAMNDYLVSNSEMGFSGFAVIANQNTVISQDKEKDAASDSCLSQALTCLGREKTDVENRISDLNREINSLQRAIEAEEERQREERRRALEESAKKLKELVTGKS
jgi:chromosome segregation ATPase